MALRFFHGSTINLVPVLMKNEGEKLCDSGSVYITQKVIIAHNGAADLPPSTTAGAAVQPPCATHYLN